ncbi:hypothetical protein AgCh_035519 [Apium graveolens]
MDRSWINVPNKLSPEYADGIDEFIKVDDVEDEVTLNSQYEDIKDDHDVLDVGLEDVINRTKSPGKDYDVFLKPLIEGLKELWDGVDVYNSYGGCIFKLRAAVLWIISDFPGHQCYLNANHSWRKSREYDGSSELREQVLQGGPVHSRWMFETERHMGLYKRYVRNMARPDSSIAEAYIVDEAVSFWSRYVSNIETRYTRPE